MGFASCKAFGRSISASLPKPQTPSHGEGATACRKVCFYKIVRILYPYPQTPFPRKGAILLGLPPLDPVGGYAPATPFLSTIEVFRQTEIITLFLLFVIRVFAVGIFVFDEDFLYIFKLVLFLFLFHIRGVREIDRLVCFVIYMVDVTVHV